MLLSDDVNATSCDSWTVKLTKTSNYVINADYKSDNDLFSRCHIFGPKMVAHERH
jgi:hypothetical protein